MSERKRRLLWASLIYVLVLVGVWITAIPERLSGHTEFNHFALMAEAWIRGRLDLGGAPPAYAGNNDFAFFDGRYYVVFPAFPAVLLAPLVAISGSAEATPDGLFFVALAGVGPALLFVALERMRHAGHSVRTTPENAGLALCFAFGSVYFFTAAQGTVWFAAHVVAVALTAIYLRCSIAAEHPFWAGLALGLGVATRTPLLFAAPLFIVEALRASHVAVETPNAGATATHRERVARFYRALDLWALATRLGRFSLPMLGIGVILLWHNQARFGDPLEFGYRYLTIVWRARIEEWGLFSYHYLAKNLGVMLTSLPWMPRAPGEPFVINHHGLALWLTTPLYVLLLWPRRLPPIHWVLWSAAIGAALPSLFYQNTGWQQFGYRFSNDYAVFLFALLAVGGWRLRGVVLVAMAWSLVVNAFGAYTFARPECARFYFTDRTQKTLYQPD